MLVDREQMRQQYFSTICQMAAPAKLISLAAAEAALRMQ